MENGLNQVINSMSIYVTNINISYGQVILIGEYKKGQKIGRWNFNYNNNQIGGGNYDEQGYKNGKWIDINDNYYGWGQITYQGVYKNGLKIGLWEINFRDSSESPFVKIGGGQYDQLGIKNGIWIDISESFDCDNQVSYVGEYKFGKKQGEWEIYYQKKYGNRSKDKIGGGFYNELGLKEGKWMDLNNKFYCLNQIIYNGEYKKGKKVGNWDINYRMYGRENFDKIHSGLYNNQNLKHDYWIEESDIFNDDNQVKYKGQYLNGRKIGRWDIINNNELIGGGNFDHSNLKTGKWIELSDDFRYKEQTIFEGEYIQGQKIGKWIRMCRQWIYGLDELEGEFQFMGENQYD
ncbi:unnamed protein product [Paramecium sonneborni]|uniref:Uncharacterized protein n=1 Tax=Paramecium sonneborni TaxID=65129 RepID=A0A8S1R110_9CILI|nr:unnamed protein product [Paramecium sonneborni]